MTRLDQTPPSGQDIQPFWVLYQSIMRARQHDTSFHSYSTGTMAQTPKEYYT